MSVSPPPLLSSPSIYSSSSSRLTPGPIKSKSNSTPRGILPASQPRSSMVDLLAAAARAQAESRRSRQGTRVRVAVKDPGQDCYHIYKIDIGDLFDPQPRRQDELLLTFANPMATLDYGGLGLSGFHLQIAPSASGHVIAAAATCGRTVILDPATGSVSSVRGTCHVTHDFSPVPVGDHAFFNITNFFTEPEEKGHTCELICYSPQSPQSPQSSSTESSSSWECCALPDPPGRRLFSQVTGYFVAGTLVWVSLGSLGTFSLDTARRRWRTQGDWVLPLSGLSLFLPDFRGSGRNLLFGFPGGSLMLCACDMDATPPAIIRSWPETCPDRSRARYDFSPNTAELTYFGDGRFCISVNAIIKKQEDGPPPRTLSSLVSFLAVEITSEMKLIKRQFRRYSLPPCSRTSYVF